MNKRTPEFSELLDRIKNGGDDNWDYFDANLEPHLGDPAVFAWAKSTALDGNPNEHYRDAAASVLARSGWDLTETEQVELIGSMQNETNPFVQHWLANSLYKRHNHHSSVVATWKQACNQNTPAGEFARGLRNAS